MSSPQRRNAELVDLLRTDFPQWDIYNQDAYARALQFALMQPGLIGAWGGVLDRNTPALVDVSGNGMHLTFNGDAHISQDTNRPLTPYIALDGTGDYMSRVDEAKLDVLGTEATIAPTLRGMTQMCWARFTNAPGTVSTLMSKWNSTGNQRSWAMGRSAAGAVFFQASTDGINVHANVNIVSATTIPATTWAFAAVRFVPSGVASVWKDLERVDAGGNGPAALFNSTASFVVGGLASATSLHNGLIALPFLCASALSDDLISYYYHMTKGLFEG